MHMSEIEPELVTIYLQPGELHVARQPAVLRTILGSCVGITFWYARLSIGALCHSVLPKCPSHRGADFSVSDGHRYVDYSIRYLAKQFDALGAQRREVEVKVFGGADVLPVRASRSAKTTVGSQNCRIALEVLQEEGLVVLASDLGGISGRIIQFHSGTGEVLLRRLAVSSKECA